MGTQLVDQPELKEMIEFKERIENNTVVEFWENSDDFEKLADTTVKTMRYVNEEQVREFADGLNQMNAKILNLTFEGVKKRQEKEIAKLGKAHTFHLACAFGVGVIVGAVIALLIARAVM